MYDELANIDPMYFEKSLIWIILVFIFSFMSYF